MIMNTLVNTSPSSKFVSKRLLGSYTVAVNEEMLDQAFNKMNTTIQSVVDDLKTGACTTVYQVQYQILPLIKPRN